ncbi:MAG: hypothetical protein HY050_09425 [Actinobacteria bacterium]|nr:hypothetical protein [Actinomycetota bacterium]
MIPTLILFGLIFDRWPWSSILIGTLGWPLLLLADKTISAGVLLLGAASYAFINTGVGVLVHQGMLRLTRRKIQVDIKRATKRGSQKGCHYVVQNNL